MSNSSIFNVYFFVSYSKVFRNRLVLTRHLPQQMIDKIRPMIFPHLPATSTPLSNSSHPTLRPASYIDLLGPSCPASSATTTLPFSHRAIATTVEPTNYQLTSRPQVPGHHILQHPLTNSSKAPSAAGITIFHPHDGGAQVPFQPEHHQVFLIPSRAKRLYFHLSDALSPRIRAAPSTQRVEVSAASVYLIGQKHLRLERPFPMVQRTK